MLYKTIVQGRLEFDKQRAYDQALRMYRHRLEGYYNLNLIFKEEEEIFNDDKLAIEIGRTVMQTTIKYWQNTVDMIRYLAQFAIAGEIGMWIVDNGRVIEHYHIAPDSEKSVVRAFKKGKKLSETKGKENEAIKSLNKAIRKYDKHSQAYERRGYVNFLLENYDDAEYDFTKAIKFDQNNPYAYYGRANVYLQSNAFKKAIDDLEKATRCAVAHQAVYWKARRLLGLCYFKCDNLQKAAFNLKLFVNRNFEKGNPNIDFLPWARNMYGRILAEQGNYKAAIEQYDWAIQLHNKERNKVPLDDILINRGNARKADGGSGYLADWKEAATLGSDKAQHLLSENA